MMWKRLSRWLQPPQEGEGISRLHVHFQVGDSLFFTKHCPIPHLQGQGAIVQRVRNYHFNGDEITSYLIKALDGREYGFSLNLEGDIAYIGISRELTSAERHSWFDPDALSFFLEKSSAQTIRCRATNPEDAPWSAPRYAKSVDLMKGRVIELQERGNSTKELIYSMLLDQDRQKAIEIEQYKEHGVIRLYSTVFMPFSVCLYGESARKKNDGIAQKGMPKIAVDSTEILELDTSLAMPITEDDRTTHPQKTAQIIPIHDAFNALSKQLDEEEIVALEADSKAGNVGSEGGVGAAGLQLETSTKTVMLDPAAYDSVPLFKEPISTVIEEAAPVKKIFRNDFRRLRIDERPSNPDRWAEDGATPPLPDFLLTPRAEEEASHQLFQQIFTPKQNEVLCDKESAALLARQARQNNMSVQELIREKIGLGSMEKEVVSIDLPLTEEDYKKLAMRYHLRPDKKELIRQRMSEELMRVLTQK